MVDPIVASRASFMDGAGKAAQNETRTTDNEQTVNKDLFLQLMVAQLRNQNPLNPVDGVDFLMQLSQISSVEQMVEMRRELEGIHDILSAGASAESAVGTPNY